MGMQEDIRRLMDLEAIRDLARRYAHCVWIKDPAGAAALFVEDCVMDTGGPDPIHGREALIAVYRNAFGQSDFQPFVHNHVIELADDRATGVCYLDLRAAIDGRSMIGAGYYHDVYIRRPDGWKFKSRQLTLAYLVPLAEGWVGR
ncbi:MAG: nuclear transport factor 2 family protein [Rhodocyclaceae bacterium]|jgi:ketosteroid isomerase-like protein|nr:nuclear transport factor 2 family protein [Rhodocyclaceae bacterium]MBK6554839.1 nuclear transport factor 2 family protein [Rhodocyclaceae bacterium]MBK6677202.1 nuclear transport factor 2 family protein [Rhodocyclaceae bacterium]MBK9309882.1 nuclear transport factor 2 family protein [Rhodocyclaceae bacterium]MBK9953632.1 nuclear transport factor 2 family protein [Rhodocyclaceae bacterium]